MRHSFIAEAIAGIRNRYLLYFRQIRKDNENGELGELGTSTYCIFVKYEKIMSAACFVLDDSNRKYLEVPLYLSSS